MKGYIISIAAAAVISAVVNMIAPDKWAKYVGIATGLVIVMCIAAPLYDVIGGTDKFEFTYESEVSEEMGSDMLRDEIKRELTERVENDAAERLKSEFGKNCTVKATVGVNEKREITGVSEIKVYGDKIDNIAAARLREVYGTEAVSYEGKEFSE